MHHRNHPIRMHHYLVWQQLCPSRQEIAESYELSLVHYLPPHHHHVHLHRYCKQPQESSQHKNYFHPGPPHYTAFYEINKIIDKNCEAHSSNLAGCRSSSPSYDGMLHVISTNESTIDTISLQTDVRQDYTLAKTRFYNLPCINVGFLY